jgi:hypothetical protein
MIINGFPVLLVHSSWLPSIENIGTCDVVNVETPVPPMSVIVGVSVGRTGFFEHFGWPPFR